MDPSRRRRGARRLWTAAVAALALPLAMLAHGHDPRARGRRPVQRRLQDQRLGFRLHRER